MYIPHLACGYFTPRLPPAQAYCLATIVLPSPPHTSTEPAQQAQSHCCASAQQSHLSFCSNLTAAHAAISLRPAWGEPSTPSGVLHGEHERASSLSPGGAVANRQARERLLTNEIQIEPRLQEGCQQKRGIRIYFFSMQTCRCITCGIYKITPYILIHGLAATPPFGGVQCVF